MFIHSRLYNPVNMTEEMKSELFERYINISREPSQTPSDMVEEIKKAFFNTHGEKTQIWQQIYPMLETNCGLAQFVLDYNGAVSEFLFPWIIAVQSSPSEALELSYNSGKNLNGDWVSDIPETDEINYFVHNMPTLIYNRERQLKVADLVMTDRDIFRSSSVLDLGAGRMAWARKHGFSYYPSRQRIKAFDVDENIKPEELFKLPPASCGIEYEKGDILSVLQNPAIDDVSLCILGGVASYFPQEVLRENIIKPIYHKLREKGSFFFDFQLSHPAYIWTCEMFNWPNFEMPEVTEAIEMAEKMRMQLRDDGIKFSASYTPDSKNAKPLSLMVLFTKE